MLKVSSENEMFSCFIKFVHASRMMAGVYGFKNAILAEVAQHF